MKSKKIRVGMIRCDTHGMWYGPLMEKHDPLIFREPMPVHEPNVESWQKGGNWYYFYTHYSQPTKMTATQIGGFELVKLWDANCSLAEMAAKVFYDRPEVCDRFEDVSDDVDLVFICDCNGDGSDHLELSTPGLKKGVATFIDKPFAYTLKDAYKMLRLADKHSAPLMSLSMMRTAPAVMQFRNRLPETGGCKFGSIYGGGTALAGLYHSIALTQGVFGVGIHSVQAMAGPRQTLVHLDYGDRKDRPEHGVTINCHVGTPFHSAFYLSAHGPKTKINSEDIGDWVNPDSAGEVLKRIKRMVRTGKPTEPASDMVEQVAVAEAFRQALDTGKIVKVPSLIRRTGGKSYIAEQ